MNLKGEGGNSHISGELHGNNYNLLNGPKSRKFTNCGLLTVPPPLTDLNHIIWRLASYQNEAEQLST